MLLLLGTTLLVHTPATATVATPPCWYYGTGTTLEHVTAEVDVQDQLARTTLTFTFTNPSEIGREARFDVPLPPRATLLSFSLERDDDVLQGEVRNAAHARATYEEARSRGDDAVLLEEADRDLRLTVYTPPGATRTLAATYVEHLDVSSGARTYRLDTSLLGAVAQTVRSVRLVLDVSSTDGIHDIAFPGVPLGITAMGDNHVRAERTFYDVDDMDDLVATWTEGAGVWSSSLARQVPETGAQNVFLSSLHYRPDASHASLPRDIVFVLDTSGSMQHDKIVQARESIREVLLSLRSDDRFGIVHFDTDVTALTPELVTAEGEHVADARARVATLAADGSTNLDGGLQRALDLLHDSSSGRVPLVVLLSDGLPTAGITNHNQIVSRLHHANEAGAAVHVIGIGLDADDTFLEDIAAGTGGTLTELAPGEDLQQRLADFYTSLEDPILTDVRVLVEGVPYTDLYPHTLPSLYRDDTLRVTFRADMASSAALSVRIIGLGPAGIVDETFRFHLAETPIVPEVDNVWGAAHVDSLLARYRQDTSDWGLRTSIIDNATRYGIVTPYTSWVIVDPSVGYDGEGDTQHAGSSGGTSPSSPSTAPTEPYDPSTQPNVPTEPTEPVEPTVPAQPTTPVGPITPPANGGGGDGDDQDTSNHSAFPPTEEYPTPAPGVIALLLLTLGVAFVLRRRSA